MYTITIPTKNRSNILARLLNYFADTNYKHWINIGDSSNVENADSLKKTIKKLEHKLKITQERGCILTGCPGIQNQEILMLILKGL